MSLIDKENFNYLSTVEQLFLSLKNSCHALSAMDYYLIQEWEERKVPLDLLCRAIETGFARYREISREGRISLNYFKRFIEEEISKTE